MQPSVDDALPAPADPHDGAVTTVFATDRPDTGLALASSRADESAHRPASPRGTLGRRIARRPQALTEGEIEARAAAIVAQARAEELAVPDEPSRPDAEPGAVADASPVAYVAFLPPLRERDRNWLGAGLVCCVVLFVFAILLVRYLAG